MVLYKKLFNNEEQSEIECQLILSYGDLFNTLELPMFELVDVSIKTNQEPLILLLDLFTATEAFVKNIKNDSKISKYLFRFYVFKLNVLPIKYFF